MCGLPSGRELTKEGHYYQLKYNLKWFGSSSWKARRKWRGRHVKSRHRRNFAFFGFLALASFVLSRFTCCFCPVCFSTRPRPTHRAVASILASYLGLCWRPVIRVSTIPLPAPWAVARSISERVKMKYSRRSDGLPCAPPGFDRTLGSRVDTGFHVFVQSP